MELNIYIYICINICFFQYQHQEVEPITIMQLRLIANLLDSHNFPLWLIYWRDQSAITNSRKKNKKRDRDQERSTRYFSGLVTNRSPN